MKLKLNSERQIQFVKFFLPIITGFGVYSIWWLISEEISMIWPLLVAYFFPPFGKETIIPLAIGSLDKGLTVPLLNIHVEPMNVNPFTIALAVAFIDIVIAWFLVWNYDLAKKIPIVGDFMDKIEKAGRKSSDKYSWFRPLRFFGIILFVMVPFQGSGGVVASIVGRLFGMKPWNTFIAITIGAITGCTLIAYFTELILSVFKTSLLHGLLIVVILVVIGIIIWMYKKNRRKS
ncbi:MAG: small multi-drug export protein [Candidatus Thermoplasmatota archaeon]